MTQSEAPVFPPQFSAVKKPMLFGATIGLLLMALFILPIEGKPEWGALWKIRPIVMVTLAGAAGGACYYLLTTYYRMVGLNKVLAYVLGAIVFIVGLWLGSVIGMDGTLWD